MKSGIYKIKNLITDKIYIGSAINLKKRWREHRHHLVNDKHKSKHLQASFNKYGEQYFVFEVIEYCEKDKLIEREQFYLDWFECYKPEKGYNTNKIANSMLGFKHSEKTKEKFKQRKASKEFLEGKRKYQEKGVSKETRDKLSKIHKGRKASNKTREIASKTHKGKITSEETKKKIKETLRKRFDKHLERVTLL